MTEDLDEKEDSTEEYEAVSRELDPEIAELDPNYRNPLTEAFLDKWDREGSAGKRHYGIKCLFAGAEDPALRDGLYRIGARRILVSYYYIRAYLKRATRQQLAEDFGRFDFVFLDSGGFTFRVMQKQDKGLDMSVMEYAEEYYQELPRYEGIFAGCAEVDVDELGTEYMEAMKEKMQSLGVPIVPVIQPPSLQPYIDLGWFEKYPYVAVGSEALAIKHMGFVERVYREAKKHHVLVHGLGATKAEILTRSQFYSVDSTTWLNGSKFGSTQMFQNGRMRHYDFKQKDVRKKFRKFYENNGIVWEDVEAEKGSEVDLANALAWRELSNYLQFNVAKSYWLSAEEKDEALTQKMKLLESSGIVDRSKSLALASSRRLAAIENADYDDRAQEVLRCDTCHMTGSCPRYKKGEVCGYDINIKIRTGSDVQRALQVLLELEFGRIMTASLFEKLEGGQLDRNLSSELFKFVGMVKEVKAIFDPRTEETLTIHAASNARSSGSSEGGGGGIASMLAGILSPTGSGKSGSGNSQVQRKANDIKEVEVIDVEKE